MIKSLLATASFLICCLGNPAMAVDVGEAFDRHATPQEAGNCYSTTGGHTVCWQRLKDRIFTLALIEKDNQPAYATTLFVPCGAEWESYGPGKQKQLQLLVSDFCTNH
jgi:hypothetical protein